VSPIAATAITGFSLAADVSNKFAISTQVDGKAFAATNAGPVPGLMTTAVLDMLVAYLDASSRTATVLGVSTSIGGLTLETGVYKWTTPLIVQSDVTLSGDADDVFIFHTTGTMTFAAGKKVILLGGVQAKNVFWVAAMTVAVMAGAHVEGIILTYTDVTFVTGASLNGRIFAQTAVNLQMATIAEPFGGDRLILPTAAPTPAPTTADPTTAPTAAPTAGPTVAPSAVPTTATPTAGPTAAPTAPTAGPTAAPTGTPISAVELGYKQDCVAQVATAFWGRFK
jgi:hypothetical protein